MDDRSGRRQRRVEGGSPKRINCRTTEPTYDRLHALAKAAGLSLPNYLIQSGLRDRPGAWSLRQQRWWAEQLEVVEVRLIRIGTNLNQMATAANATGELPEGLSGALAYFNETLARHQAVLDAIAPAGTRAA
ncbi:plasmid mobilization relaxosome protein MobC [Crossiella sp. CA-258035]|uniref:plasmid mobilization protein n=1 Tax=Crossiella sp. CA-258035 TaxID=2981138 RepID=UPI0024BCF10C|nr:plasmid mobilization relaxosome protein MobC [Crossiella sp. CA-258035]WHT21885.1 plasmid mobilization relaxosome protein MobC [Crossiella sp. CA-258035]